MVDLSAKRVLVQGFAAFILAAAIATPCQALTGSSEERMAPALDPRGWLGMGITLRRSAEGHAFLHVEGVSPGGPAEKAGIKALDVITSIRGEPLRFRHEVEVLEFIATLGPGDVLPLEIRRAEKSLRVRLHVAELTTDQRKGWLELYQRARRNLEREQKSDERRKEH